MLAAVAAMIIANSPFSLIYFDILKAYVAGLSILHWINDALMAVFFLLIGLEIKREMLDGQLSSWSHRILPGIAAVGGMAVPAIVYLILNANSPETWRGWAIASATDIAFALGVLAFLGKRVPVSLKIFLTAVAIVDDLGAVMIIAVFYTADLSFVYLVASLFVLGVLRAFNSVGLPKLSLYLIVGLLLWFLVFKSGVHATLAGVALAFTIPMSRSPGRPDDALSPLHRLEHALHPWVTFLIVPLFGFANAGVSLSGVTLANVLQPVTLGIASGLFFGKQIGIFASVWLSIKCGWSKMPQNSTWPQVYGISLLCGIGFTMSLFIGLLAFPDSVAQGDAVKMGVLMGSLASGAVGATILYLSTRIIEPPKDATS